MGPKAQAFLFLLLGHPWVKKCNNSWKLPCVSITNPQNFKLEGKNSNYVEVMSNLFLEFRMVWGNKCNKSWERKDRICQLLVQKNTRLNSTLINKKLRHATVGITQMDFDDVAKLLCLLLPISLFFNNIGNTLRWGYAPYIENLDEFKKYDWCRAIHDALISSLMKKKGIPLSQLLVALL